MCAASKLLTPQQVKKMPKDYANWKTKHDEWDKRRIKLDLKKKQEKEKLQKLKLLKQKKKQELEAKKLVSKIKELSKNANLKKKILKELK